MSIFILQNSLNGRSGIDRNGSGACSPAGSGSLSRAKSITSSSEGFTSSSEGFTLVELLVSTAIISLIMLMLVQVTNSISAAWRSTAEKIEKFEGARDGFEAMTRRISQATLNTYWDYYDVSGVTRNQAAAPGSFLPFSYGRQSDLRFLCGPMSGVPWSISSNTTLGGNSRLSSWPTHGIFFAAPLGVVDYNDQPIYGAMNNLLNTWGYFVEVNCDLDSYVGGVPSFVATANPAPPPRWRARLMEFREPSENMTTYQVTNLPSSSNRRDWIANSLINYSQFTATNPNPTRPARVLAENVVALIFLPRLSTVDESARRAKGWSMLSPEYTFDSTLAPTTANTGQVPTLTEAPVNPGAKVTSNTDASDAGGIDPRNQLPPVIEVIMIALDERSAQRLVDLTNAGASTNIPTGIGSGQTSHPTLLDPTFGGLYTQGSVDGNPLFTTALAGGAAYTDQLGDAETAGTDLYAFTQSLVAKKLTYRIFSTNVTIRGAKWSRAQAN